MVRQRYSRKKELNLELVFAQRTEGKVASHTSVATSKRNVHTGLWFVLKGEGTRKLYHLKNELGTTFHVKGIL